MPQILVQYQPEAGTVWAKSPDVPGFSASASTLRETRELVKEGLPFFLDVSEELIDLREIMADGSQIFDVALPDLAIQSADPTERPFTPSRNLHVVPA